MPDHDNRSQIKQTETGSSSLSSRTAELAGKELSRPRRRIDYLAVREAVSMAQVLELIAWSPVGRSGPQLRGPCPIHKSSSETSRSFSVNNQSNVFQCFGCGAKGNQLDLYMAVTGLPVYDAAFDLVQRLQLNFDGIEKRNP